MRRLLALALVSWLACAPSVSAAAAGDLLWHDQLDLAVAKTSAPRWRPTPGA